MSDALKHRAFRRCILCGFGYTYKDEGELCGDMSHGGNVNCPGRVFKLSPAASAEAWQWSTKGYYPFGGPSEYYHWDMQRRANEGWIRRAGMPGWVRTE